MSTQRPVQFGVVGLGGYAVSARTSLLDMARIQPDLVKLVALFSPETGQFPEKVAELQALGITVYPTLAALLEQPLDAVWLPTPIDTHCPLTIAALQAGKAVLCEKPAAGSVDDVDRMIVARDEARRPVAIGFQDMHHPTTLPLKRDLLGGRIGKIRHATVQVVWPRNSLYFGRNPWAGRFKRNGAWVMDSPANNACAHYLAMSLFLLGTQLHSAAQPVHVEAELYRANDIENFDTISMRLRMDDGASLLVLMTHAAERNVGPIIHVHGDQGSLHWTQAEYAFQTSAGRQATTRDPHGGRLAMVERFCHEVRGQASPLDVMPCSLEVARTQVLAVNAASEATAVHTIPADAYRVLPFPQGGTVRAVPGIEKVMDTCVQNQQMLHESGLLGWTQPAGHKDLRGYRHFAGPVGTCASVQ